MPDVNVDEVSSFINQEAIKQEKEILVNTLKEALAIIKQINTVGDSVKGATGIKDATKAIKDYSTELAKASIIEEKVAASKARTVKATNENIQADIQAERLKREVIKTENEVIKQILLEEQVTQALLKSKKLLNAEKVKAPATVADDPTNANIPYTNNLDQIEAEKQALTESGTVVGEFAEKEREAQIAAAEFYATQAEGITITKEQAATLSEISLKYDKYTGSIEANLQVQIQNATALEQNKVQQKEIEDAITRAGVASEGQIQKLAALKAEALQLTEANKLLSITIRNQAKEANAASGSLDQLDAQLVSLQTAYSSLTAAEKASPFGKEIKAEIDLLDPKVKALNAEMGKFGKNVGNYTGAINILKQSLTEAAANLEQLTQAGKLNSEQGQQLVTEVSLLTELVGQQQQGFSSLAREVLNTGRALETLQANGLENTVAFSNLEQEFIKAKQRLNEFRREQTLLTSEAPKLNALLIAARGLGGLYATGAGAAALFANGNEKVEKELNKLVAIMTLLQGLQEVHKLLLEKNAIATALFGTSTAGATVALEGEAVAATEAGVATGFFGKALAFIAANPIVLTLTALAGVLLYLASTYKSAEEQAKKSTEASRDFSNAIDSETDIIEKQNKILNKNLELQKQRAEALLKEKQATGINAATELAFKEEINILDQKITAEELASHPKITEDLKAQNEELQKQIDKQKAQAQLVLDLTAKQKAGVKTVVKNFDIQESAGDTRSFQKVTVHAHKNQDIEDAIKEANDVAKLNNEAVDAAQKTVNKLQAIKDKADKVQEEADLIKLEKARLAAEELRKVEFASAQISVQLETDKNNLILANEHSTFEQRIAALKDNAKLLKNLAAAELKNVTSDPTKIGTAEETIARKAYAAKIEQINADSNAVILKVTEDNTKRILAAELAAQKTLVEVDQQTQLEIVDNLEFTLKERLEALQKYNVDKKVIIDNEYEFTKKTAILNNEELQALEADHNAKLTALAAEVHKKTGDVLASEMAINKTLRDNDLANLKSYYDKLSLASTQAYAADVEALNKSFQAKEISYEQYLRKREKLNESFSLNNAKQELADLEAQLKKYEDNSQEIENIQEEIYNNQYLLNQDIDTQEKLLLADRIKRLKDLLKYEKDIAAERLKLEKAIATAKTQIADAEAKGTKKTTQQTLDDLQKVFEKVGELSTNLSSTITNIAGIGTDKQKASVDELEAKQQLAYDNEVARINSLNISDQQRSEMLSDLEALRARQKAANDAQQRRIAVEQARFDKAANITSIITTTALAVVKALATGGPFAIPLAVTTGILGAVQLARAIAQPIPNYRTGKGAYDKYAGMAMTNEVRPEPIYRADTKTIEMSTKKNNLTYVGKNDIVFPSIDHLINSALFPQLTPMSEIQQSQQVDFSRVISAIDRISIATQIVTEGGHEYRNNKLSDYEAWVRKYITG